MFELDDQGQEGLKWMKDRYHPEHSLHSYPPAKQQAIKQAIYKCHIDFTKCPAYVEVVSGRHKARNRGGRNEYVERELARLGLL